MKWSWRIARIGGIDVYVHFTLLILLGWVALSHFLNKGSVEQALGGFLFVVLLFGIIVLHELGHALTAKRFGIRTRDITLLPIGGVARLEKMPERPREELLVALAGPAVNVALAAILLGILALSHGLAPWGDVVSVGGSLLDQLFWVNVAMAGFNMLPAFPMDGGRVLRALLAMRWDYVRATQVAATIGQGVALLAGMIGLFVNPFLVFVALFVWLGAEQEASLVLVRAALSGIPIRRAMITEFTTLGPNDALSRAVERVLEGSQQDFPVVEGGQILGILTRADLIRVLSERGPGALVGDAMHREFETADPLETLESVLPRLHGGDCNLVPVLQNGSLVGLLTSENLSELFLIQQALRTARSHGQKTDL